MHPQDDPLPADRGPTLPTPRAPSTPSELTRFESPSVPTQPPVAYSGETQASEAHVGDAHVGDAHVGETLRTETLRTETLSTETGRNDTEAVVTAAAGAVAPPQQLAYSTFLSLLVVLVLIVTIRFTVPPLVESLRYSWHHGQLRAEYEVSGQQLQNVSLSTLSEASELVSRRVGPSVVHINLLKAFELRGDVLPGELEERHQLVGQGSGVILDTDGHILTNEHVIKEAGRIEVSLSDGRRLVAREIGIDPLTDLAIIKIDAAGLMPVEWGDSDKMDVGTPVWAVGSPFGLERTVTFGILSGKHRIDLKGTRYDSLYSGTTTYGDLMQSDVAVNPGNSGGPLVNSSGEIIGINTAIVGETYIGISFSIPSNVAKRVAAGLIGEGEVARGWLGVSLSDPLASTEPTDLAPQRGALVRQWAPTGESPAKAAGILPGDIIVKFANQAVTSRGSLMSLVAQTDVGSSVPVELLRNGQPMTLQVEIGRRPTALDVR